MQNAFSVCGPGFARLQAGQRGWGVLLHDHDLRPAFLVVHHADGGTFVRVHDHKPGAGQGLERLAHRGLGYAEHLGQVGLDQGLARFELSRQDRVLDRVEHGHRARREGTRAVQDQIRSRHHVPRLVYDV